MKEITMMDISVMSVQYAHYSFEYFLASMEVMGIKNIELWAGEPHFCDDGYPDFNAAVKRIHEMRRKLSDKGMKVICLTPEQLNYPVNIAACEDRLQKRSVDYFTRNMEYALEFGTDKLFITSGVGMRDKSREECWKRSRESLCILAERAGKYGVTIFIEQLQPYESNLLTTCEDMVRMIREVDSEHLQCCVDVVAMAVVGDRLEDFFERLPGRIRHIHLGDGNPSGHYILGAAELPLKDYLETLRDKDYEGYITLEINDSIYIEDPHKALLESMDYLRNYIQLKE